MRLSFKMQLAQAGLLPTVPQGGGGGLTRIVVSIQVCKRLLAGAIGLLAVFSYFAQAMDNKTAMDEFNAQTEEIMPQSSQVTDDIFALLDRMIQQSGSQMSAVKALTPANLNQLHQFGEQALFFADQYLHYYQQFQSNLSPESTCYQPQTMAEIQQQITQARQENANIQALASTDWGKDESSAAIALLNVQMHAGKLSMLTATLEMTKMCYLSEAMGLSHEDLLKMERLEEGEYH